MSNQQLPTLSNADLEKALTHSENNSPLKPTDGETTSSVELDQDDFPEGGRGWLVVTGCLCCSMMTFGIINSYGAFQTYYETIYFPDVPSMKLSIIGGCQPSLAYFFTPLFVPLVYAIGLRNSLTIGTTLIVVALFGLSSLQPGELWKCYLFHGVMFPIGASFLFPAVLFTPIEWFKRKRATALGIAMCGISLGGVFWPIVVKNMTPHQGFQWMVRTIAFVCIPLSIVIVVLTPQRLEEKYIHKPNPMSNCTFSKQKLRELPKTYRLMFKSWFAQTREVKYDFMIFSNLLGMIGSYPALFYVDLFATLIAPKAVITNYLLVILNLFGFPGRIVSGLLGDRIGRFNALFILMAGSGLSVLAIWLPLVDVGNIAGYSVFIALFGFFLASFSSLFPACFAQQFGTHDSEARIGFLIFSSTPGPLLGCVIAGSFIPVDSADINEKIQAFKGLTGFTGAMLLGCALVLWAVRLSIKMRPFAFV